MPRTPEYNTVSARAQLLQKMWALATCDTSLFAEVSPFSEEGQTRYRTTNTMVKKRPKKGRNCVEIDMVEMKCDLLTALQNNRFDEALSFYMPLSRLVGLS